MKTIKLYFLFAFIAITTAAIAQPTPPNGKKWQLVNNMSDEFNGNTIDRNKWGTTNATGWIGRSPGLFVENTIKIANGNLQITNYKLNNPVNRNGKNFTHACGLVASKNSMIYGYYEARMQASKTFMSSTFWLINDRNEGTGCDKRTTELDIQETVGAQSGPDWVQNTIRGMGSNTHSRNTSCNNTPVGKEGASASLNDQSWQSYHTYGAWWKSKNEILFYLDGKFVHKVTPPADFDLPMYLRMVTETYDWNPVPADGGMTGSAASRTTYYDWVHTYKLVDATSTPPPTVGQLIKNDTYFIESTTSSQRMLSRPNNQHKATMHAPLNFNDQKWVFNHLGNNIYTIKNAGTNRFLEIPFAKCQNSTQVATYTNVLGDHQKWEISENGTDIYTIKPAHCLTQALDRNNGTINTNVITYAFGANNNNQKWKIKSTSPNSKLLGIGDNNKKKAEIIMSPNPAKGYTKIGGLTIGDTITVNNLQGKVILELKARDTEEIISTSSLQQGLYIVSISKKARIKLIVN